ncbi:ABC transporter substrate-binding protein [Acidipropionibacterium thoenii]|uniref:ABC transporter substrate-binding protein n=1 Tax=Acidipropionibacterium thoenii TaxID=1751 RepID=UPI0003F717FA|nr:ABC transporter substrate-binding protein [Acidipropionibacterium thoenii]
MRNRSRTIRRVSASLVAATLLAAGSIGGAGSASAAPSHDVADSSASPSTSASPSVLRIATSGFVDSFNPFTSIYLLPTNSIRYMYENLVANDQKDGSPTKGLADSWKTSNDGKTWTFTMQDGLKWSDGQPITSADVKYTYDQMMKVPDLAVANGNLVSNFASVEAPDAKTLVINLKTAQAPNPGVEIPIVPEHIWSKIKDPAKFTNESNTVGSGPFQLVSYKANQSIVFKANPSYWRGAPKVSGLQYIYYTNSDAQVQALRSGDVDFVTGLTSTQFNALKGATGVTTHSGLGRRYTSISINSGMETTSGQAFGTGAAALKDVKVRQALRQAIDNKTLLSKVLNGQGTEATSFIPASFPKWSLPTNSPVIIKYDPAAAEKTLDADGWKVGSDGIRAKNGQKLSLRLLVDSSDPTEQTSADYLKPWLKKVGIDLKVQSSDSDTISDKTVKGDYDMYFSGWSINPDPDYQLGINTCSSRPTRTDGTGGTTQDGYCNPAFDKLYAEQRAALDETKRRAIVQKMLEMNYTDTPQIAIWYGNSLEAYRSDRFTGFALQPSNNGIIANQAGAWGFLEAAPVAGSTNTSSSHTGLVVGGIVVAVLVIAGVVWLLVRRRHADETE